MPIFWSKTMDSSTFSCCTFQDATWYASCRHVLCFPIQQLSGDKWFLLYEENNQALWAWSTLHLPFSASPEWNSTLRYLVTRSIWNFFAYPSFLLRGEMLFHAIVIESCTFCQITWRLHGRNWWAWLEVLGSTSRRDWIARLRVVMVRSHQLVSKEVYSHLHINNFAMEQNASVHQSTYVLISWGSPWFVFTILKKSSAVIFTMYKLKNPPTLS